MSKIHIKYMTDEALSVLRGNISTVTKYMENNPDDCKWLNEIIPQDINLYVVKKFEIEDFELSIPKDEQDKETDISNSILLYESLKELPLYVLTDERFWNWINFEKAYPVALKYMPVNKGKNIFRDHWLFSFSNRRSLFFGVMSRCFFRVALTVDDTLDDIYEYSRFVIQKPERFRNLSWRAFSGEKKIVLGTLKAEKRILTDYKIEEKIEYFTELAKEISKLGSVMLLDVMEEKDIENFIYKKYKKMFKEGEVFDLLSVNDESKPNLPDDDNEECAE